MASMSGFDLERSVEAQEGMFEQACAELRRGRRRGTGCGDLPSRHTRLLRRRGMSRSLNCRRVSTLRHSIGFVLVCTTLEGIDECDDRGICPVRAASVFHRNASVLRIKKRRRILMEVHRGRDFVVLRYEERQCVAA